MMSFLLTERTDLIGELERLNKVVEGESTNQDIVL